MSHEWTGLPSGRRGGLSLDLYEESDTNRSRPHVPFRNSPPRERGPWLAPGKVWNLYKTCCLPITIRGKVSTFITSGVFYSSRRCPTFDPDRLTFPVQEKWGSGIGIPYSRAGWISKDGYYVLRSTLKGLRKQRLGTPIGLVLSWCDCHWVSVWRNPVRSGEV